MISQELKDVEMIIDNFYEVDLLLKSKDSLSVEARGLFIVICSDVKMIPIKLIAKFLNRSVSNCKRALYMYRFLCKSDKVIKFRNDCIMKGINC